MAHHQFNWHGNVNKLIKTIIVLSIPVGIIAVVFWNVFPVAKVVLFSFITLVGIGVFDRLLSWSFGGYEHRRGQFFAFLVGIVIGVILVSNGILPELTISIG